LPIREVGLAATAQKFGGEWTLIKVDTVAAYLAAFNKVMKNLGFRRIYIDAFAGSGDFKFKVQEAIPLLDMKEVIETYPGSAHRALMTDPPFDELLLIEQGKRNAEALKRLQAKYPEKNTTVLRGDANVHVQHICRTTNWRGSRPTRGVIFLDPFGNSVDWSTIQELGTTKLDVWYLFPLSGVYRNAPNDFAQLTKEKRDAITRVLGTTEWETRFYEPPPKAMLPLFNHIDERKGPNTNNRRTLNVDGIEQFIAERLRSVFPLVLEPRRLYGPTNAPLFSLFFAMANRSVGAQRVASAIAQHLLDDG
jgi:three-Cys-motif partner protein